MRLASLEGVWGGGGEEEGKWKSEKRNKDGC